MSQSKVATDSLKSYGIELLNKMILKTLGGRMEKIQPFCSYFLYNFLKFNLNKLLGDPRQYFAIT